jgi:bifunctional non-homologous end joining protein LigD
MAKKRATASARLGEYRKKRNFTKTPEPTGGEEKSTAAGKKKESYFCVQKHLASHLHYDFRLEHAGVLLSWAVPKGPSLNPKDKRLAMRTEDHPFDYGEFEGVIPEGYGAGIVMLWDKGTWEPENGEVDSAIEKGEIKFKLNGVKLKGSWVLVRTGGRGGGGDRSWLLIKHRDEWAGDVDVAKLFPRSVKSDGDFEDILAAENPNVWESHRPAQGGAAGAMFAEIIERAARKKVEREQAGAAGGAESRGGATKSAKKAKRARTPKGSARPKVSATRR